MSPSSTTRLNVLEAALYFANHFGITSDVLPAVNPLVEYVQSLPEWDGQQPDYIAQVAGMVHLATDEEQQLFATCFRKWFVAMVASWLDEEVVNHQVLVLKCRAFPERKIRRVIEQATGLVVDQGGFVCMAKDEQETSKVFCSDVAPSDLAEQMGPTRTRIEENKDR